MHKRWGGSSAHSYLAPLLSYERNDLFLRRNW
jgi:hypothetical protein